MSSAGDEIRIADLSAPLLTPLQQAAREGAEQMPWSEAWCSVNHTQSKPNSSANSASASVSCTICWLVAPCGRVIKWKVPKRIAFLAKGLGPDL